MSALQQSVRSLARTVSTPANPAGDRERFPMNQYVPEFASARGEQIRNRNLQLIPEALARAQMSGRLRRAGYRARRAVAARL